MRTSESVPEHVPSSPVKSLAIAPENLLSLDMLSEDKLSKYLQQHGISLTTEETRKIITLLGRNPSLTELHMFNIQWSEHCSYKSSKKWLKLLPTTGKNVILGPAEDAGIIELGVFDNERYGLVIGHESHNHPSQVVPYEGAATGIGGILRDVLCMGAKIIATADPLRFGNPNGKQQARTKYIANAVVDGIAGYGNPVGIPNLAGDVYFNESFDENCLVNVVCLGIVKEDEIIHSKAPHGSGEAEYDLVIVGKATDASGFGGASFASVVLQEENQQNNKGAVQVPDPFLKNMLIRATYTVFQAIKERKLMVGFKDMGAGGIMCSTAELCDAGGYGAMIDLDKVPVSIKGLPPYIIACAETQERFTWVVPKSFTPTLLRIYNEDFALPQVSEGAQATVIGKVTKSKDYILTHQGKVVCHAPAQVITTPILYDRPIKRPTEKQKEKRIPFIEEPEDYHDVILKLLRLPHIASKSRIYEHYDTNVMGNTIIGTGQADAGLLAPLSGKPIGVALTTDCNPVYNRIDPYWGAAHAVAESMRNIAAIGATPVALTDCLCYGNPEDPESFWSFTQGVKGIADAATNLWLKGTKVPVPIVSGNVSFYNSSKGKSIDPSPIIAAVGTIQDYSKAITLKIKQVGSGLYLIGPRIPALGGSSYYGLSEETGALPPLDFVLHRNMLYTVIDAIDKRLVLACHDISDGGLMVSVVEMMLGGNADGTIGVELYLNDRERLDHILFTESPGFVLEIADEHLKEVEKIGAHYGIDLIKIGETVAQSSLRVEYNGEERVKLSLTALKTSWTRGLIEALE